MNETIATLQSRWKSPVAWASLLIKVVGILMFAGKITVAQAELSNFSGGQYLGTAATKAIMYNSQSIAENVTIGATQNALSAGPITIADGYTVTINDGGTWTIV